MGGEEGVGNEIRPKELNFVAANPPGVPTHSGWIFVISPHVIPPLKSGVTFRPGNLGIELETFRIKYDRSVISIDRNSILPYERPLYTVLLCVFILGKSFRGKLAAIDRVYPFRYSFLRTARGGG